VKAWYGELKDVKVVDLNRILKQHGVRLVVKKAKEWGKNVTVTAHPVVARKRVTAPAAVVGTGAAGGG
jgi:hypothetical protein